MTDKEAERKRLAEALRANLKRRKAAARPASDGTSSEASGGAPSMARDEAEGHADAAPKPAQDGDRG